MSTQITIAIQCHRFQRRLCWMLSSLAQQTASDRVRVMIAHHPPDGQPDTRDVIELFSRKITIQSQEFASLAEFQLRGLVRNRQLMECATEWLMFGDADMVYSPDYFETLLAYLDRHHAGATYMLSSGRMSNPKELTEELVCSKVNGKAVEVAGAFALADRLPKREMRNVGAGFCQLVHATACPHGGYYVRPEENRDWRWDRGSNPKSDMQFRRRIEKAGGRRVKLSQWFTDRALHLNHDRDPEAGRHLETQR